MVLPVALFVACPIFDNQSPTVNITVPADGATVSETVTVSVAASDDTEVRKVQLFIDGELQSEDTSRPFEFNWDTTTLDDGEYDLKAVAIDLAGNEGSDDDTSVVVDNSVAETDTSNPTVNITAPADGDTVSGTVSITADASDDVALQSVEFFIAGTSVGTDTSAPYSYEWDTTAGSDGDFALKAVATDTAGNAATDDDTSVTVDNTTPDTTNPTVNITAPSNGATVSSTVTITAEATDDFAVASVEFFIADTSVSTDTSAPYSYDWDTTAGSDGDFALKAVATDTAGNTATDDDTAVTVDNSPGAATWDNVTWDNFNWE